MSNYRKIPLRLTLIFILLLMCFSGRVSAVSYYVDDVGGSDVNIGTSINFPIKSISKVNSLAISPGDVVSFKRGGSWSGTIDTARSGTDGNPIVYTAYGNGSAPVLTNPCSGCYSNVFVIRGSWIVIKDLYLKDTHHAAIILRAGSSNVTISDNEISNTGIGIFLQTSNHTVSRNTIHDLQMVVNNTSNPDDDYGANGIWLEHSDNNEISYNTCKNCRAPSFDYGFDGGFVEFWTGNNNNNIHHNWVENTNGFIEIGGNDPGGTVSNNTISYNVLYNNLGFGCLHTDGNFRASVDNLIIEHNTIVNLNVDGYRMLDCMAPTPSMITFRNNIVVSPIQIANSGNFTRSNNLYYMLNGASIGYSLNSGEKIGNPLFVNIDNKDFRLQSSSPARDSGINLGYTTDFVSNRVPSGVSPDIGAYEFGYSTVISPTNTSNKPGDANSDNKVNGQDYIFWLNHYGITNAIGFTDGDFNGDNNVNGKDYIVWLNNYEN